MNNKTLTQIANYISRHSKYTLDDWKEDDYATFMKVMPEKDDIKTAKQIADIIEHDKDWSPRVTVRVGIEKEYVSIKVTLRK